MKAIAVMLAAAVLGAAIPAFAQHSHDHASATSSAGAAWTEGEVRKVDKEAGKLTLKHGPIVNLEMPGMTMVFRVKDTALLDKVKAGDKVKFKADKVDGNLTVMEIEAAQ